jgi:hypothetical protein
MSQRTWDLSPASPFPQQAKQAGWGSGRGPALGEINCPWTVSGVRWASKHRHSQRFQLPLPHHGAETHRPIHHCYFSLRMGPGPPSRWLSLAGGVKARATRRSRHWRAVVGGCPPWQDGAKAWVRWCGGHWGSSSKYCSSAEVTAFNIFLTRSRGAGRGWK